MNIQVADRITYKNLDGDIITRLIYDSGDLKRMEKALKSTELIKIERPKYEVVEEKKELLTEEERAFLKQYIKIINGLNNGQIISIRKQPGWIILELKTGLEYQADIGSKFKNMEDCKKYNFSELGLEEN